MGEERRRFSRVPCHLPVQLVLQGEPRVIQTLTKDLAEGGLRCLSPVPLPALTPCSIEIVLGSKRSPIHLYGYTRWIEPVENGSQFYLGLAFDRTSPWDTSQLSGYLNHLAGYAEVSSS